MSFLPGFHPGFVAIAAQGGAPSILGSAITQGSLAAPYTTNLPSSIQSGEFLAIFVTSSVGGGHGAFTAPTGWSTQYDVAHTNTTFGYSRAAMFYRTADGTEGATVTFPVLTGFKAWAAVAIRVGPFSGFLDGATIAQAVDTAPNPPSLTPAYGGKATLWLAVAHVDFRNTADSITADPTGYTGGISAVAPGSGSASLTATRVTEKQLFALTEDPAAYTLSASKGNGGQTIGVN